MRVLEKARNWLYEPVILGVNVDEDELLDLHIEILERKYLLKSAFQSFYEIMFNLGDRYFQTGSGKEIELGSGSGFIKKVRPSVVTSDIRKNRHHDTVINAQEMVLDSASVRCFYAINVFHHLPDPEKFFSELIRVLEVGGGCILVEPHIGFSSALLHRYVHKDEQFEPEAISWKTPEIMGPLSGANQALSYIVFERDHDDFQKKYGGRLEIVRREYCLNSFRYFLSGGLNFRQLLPSFCAPLLKGMESLFKPFAKHWSLHQVTVIRKVG